MDQPSGSDQDRDDQDRVVSRRVDNPTEATESDERAYTAAQSGGPDATNPTGAGASSAERAASDFSADDESEPTRSE